MYTLLFAMLAVRLYVEILTREVAILGAINGFCCMFLTTIFFLIYGY